MQRKMIRNELNIYFYVNCNVFYLHKINEYKWNDVDVNAKGKASS